MSTYNRQDVTFERGEGVWLWDTAGRRYFDALCGIAVCGLGHAHPSVTEALCLQAGELLHTSNLYRIGLQEQLGDRLSAVSGLENAFFCNSGAEANEVALKIARRYGHEIGIDAPVVLTMTGSFHGRTMATLSATGNPKVQQGFEPLVPGFLHIPYGDIEAVSDVIARRDDVAAVLVEPIQGEGGIVVPPSGYVDALRTICDENNALLMLDEIQTGMGRTGKWFAFQHETSSPDVMTLAKSLGNGVPIGACLAGPRAASVLQPGTHGSTFGGNPLACRAALAVLSAVERELLLDRCNLLSDKIMSEFNNTLATLDGVREIRGKGLMIAVEFVEPGSKTPNVAATKAIMERAREDGLLLGSGGMHGNSLRIAPPLSLTTEEADQGFAIIKKAIEDVGAL